MTHIGVPAISRMSDIIDIVEATHPRLSSSAQRIFLAGPSHPHTRSGSDAGPKRGEQAVREPPGDRLRVCDVDLFRKLVRVRQAVWHGKVQTPKTKNAIRDIPVPVEIVDALRTHIGDRKVLSSQQRTARLGMPIFC